jgi:hypothetical protein
MSMDTATICGAGLAQNLQNRPEVLQPHTLHQYFAGHENLGTRLPTTSAYYRSLYSYQILIISLSVPFRSGRLDEACALGGIGRIFRQPIGPYLLNSPPLQLCLLNIIITIEAEHFCAHNSSTNWH